MAPKKSLSKEVRAKEKKQLAAPPVLCVACDQTTHSTEKWLAEDAPSSLLSWHKWSPEHGHPFGRECYCCFDTRRTHFRTPDGKVPDLETLLNSRKDGEINKKIEERRKAKSSGSSEFKKEAKIKTTKFIEKRATKMKEIAEEGDFVPLATFALNHTVPHLDDDEAIKKYIKTHYNYQCEYDGGELGVLVPDKAQGVKRYRKGGREEVAHGERQEIDDDDDEAVAGEVEKLKLDQEGVPDGVEVRGLGALSVSDAGLRHDPFAVPSGCGRDSAAGVPVRPRSAFSEAREGTAPSEASAASRRRESSPQYSQPRASPPRAPSVASSALPPMTPIPRASPDKKSDDGVSDLVVGDGDKKKTREKKVKLTAKEALMKDASELLQEASRRLAPDQLWHAPLRKRDQRSLMERLSWHGSKCTGIQPKDLEATELSAKLFALYERVETDTGIIKMLREDPVQITEKVTKNQLDRVRSWSKELLASIFASVAEGLATKADENSFGALMRMASADANNELNYRLLTGDGESEDIVGDAQKSVVSFIVESLMKQQSRWKSLILAMKAKFPDVGREAFPMDVPGWSAGVVPDLLLIFFLEELHSGGLSGKLSWAPEQRRYAAAIFEKKNLISVRLRTLSRMEASRSSVNHFYTSWSLLQELATNMPEPERVKDVTEKLEKIAADLDAEGDYTATYNRIVEIYNDHMAVLEEAAQCIGLVTAEEGANELTNATKKLRESFIAFLKEFLQDTSTLQKTRENLFYANVVAENSEEQEEATAAHIPEEVEEELAVADAVFHLVLVFEGRPTAVLEKMRARVATFTKVTELKAVERTNVADAIRQWSDLVMQEKKDAESTDRSATDSGTGGEELETALETLSKDPLSKCVYAFLERVMHQAGQWKSTPLLAAMEETKGTFACEVKILMTTFAVFMRVRTTEASWNDGDRGGSLLELFSIMDEIEKCKEVPDSMGEEWTRCTTFIKGKLQIVFDDFAQKAAGEDLKNFISKYECVLHATSTWDFTDCAFMKTPTAAGAPEQNLGMQMEHKVRAVANLSTQAATISTYERKWMSEEEKVSAEKVFKDMSELKIESEKAARILANMQLGCLLLSLEKRLADNNVRPPAMRTDINDCLKYCAVKLKVTTFEGELDKKRQSLLSYNGDETSEVHPGSGDQNTASLDGKSSTDTQAKKKLRKK